MSTALWLLVWLLTPQGVTSNSISGTVVRALTDQPLVNEEVGLWPTSRTVRTDQFGKFLFRNVDPGDYALVVVHDRIRVRIPVVLTAVARVENITVEVKPAPAIAGTVFDPFGERAAAVRVQAYRRIYRPSGARLRSVMSVMTDDLGDYRLFRLQPGEYYVSASLSEREQRLGSVGMRLTPNLTKPDDGFPTLYFGDAYNANQSRRINLGQLDNSGTNIYLKDGPRFSVSGTLVGESPSGFVCGQVAVIPEGGLLDPERDFSANVCGGFRIAGLSPGSYYVTAVGVGLASDTVQFSIQNRNIERLNVPMSRTMTMNGRVASEGAISPGGLRVQLVRAMSGLDQRLEAIVERDGSFAIQNVGPGIFDALIDPLPDKAFLSAVRFQGQDGIRGPLFVAAGTVTTPARGGRGGNLGTRLDLQLSLGVAAEGTAVDANGKPVPGAEVVLIPAAYRNREDRYLRTFADTAGNFRVNGIPPGGYTLFAFEDIEPGAYYAFGYDNSLAQRYATRGQRLEFGEGTDRQQLKITVIPAFETAGGLR
jgi:hypothetical protein